MLCTLQWFQDFKASYHRLSIAIPALETNIGRLLQSADLHPPPQTASPSNDHLVVANPIINTTIARSVSTSAARTLVPLVQIDAVSFATARADPIVAAISFGDGAEAGAVLDVAGRFDADGTGGSGLEGFGFLGDGEGGGANAEEREACEGGEGEHGIVLSGREVVSTRGAVLLELSRRGRTLKSDGERGRCFFVSE